MSHKSDRRVHPVVAISAARRAVAEGRHQDAMLLIGEAALALGADRSRMLRELAVLAVGRAFAPRIVH